MKFVNGVELNKAHPKTFLIPSEEQKASITAFDFIKVGALLGTGRFESERFWVKVISADHEARTFTGVVNNDLVGTNYHGFKYGDAVTVSYDEVLAFQ